jgi:hypothetical protein
MKLFFENNLNHLKELEILKMKGPEYKDLTTEDKRIIDMQKVKSLIDLPSRKVTEIKSNKKKELRTSKSFSKN